MTPQPDVEKIIRQTRRYEFQDGLRDLQMGLYFLVSALSLWLILNPAVLGFLVRLGQNYGRWAVGAGGLLLMAAPLVAVFAGLRLMQYLRRRWLWRRSGMVQASLWAVPRRISIVSAVILVAGMGLSLWLRSALSGDEWFIWRALWAATGWAFGYTLVALGRHLDLSRYLWLGLAGGLASTALLILPLSMVSAAVAFSLGWGLLLLGSGAVALGRAWPEGAGGANGG